MDSSHFGTLKLVTAFSLGLVLSGLMFYADSNPSESSDIREWIELENHPTPLLSESDLAYLSSIGEIKKCVDPHWLPLEGIRKGEHIGVIAELLGSVEQALGSPMKLVETENWAQSMEYLKAGMCDIVTSDVAIGEPEDYLKTIPFINLHHVYVTRTSEPIEVEFSNINHLPIGIPQGYPTKELLTHRYGRTSFVDVATVDDGLLMVSKGELFAFADILPVISYSLGQQGLTNVKVGGHLDLDLPTVMAVSKDKPELVNILNKLFLAADRSISNQLLSNWVHIKYDITQDWARVMKTSVFFGALLVLVVIWNRKLSSINQQLDISNSELKRLTEQDSLTSLNNRYYLNEVLSPKLIEMQSRVSLALIDIDYFKKINDTYGHNVGDQCLQHFSRLLQATFCAKGDHCIRYGGEEFLVISEEYTKPQFLAVLEQLRAVCESSILTTHDNSEVSFTASAGYVASISIDSRSDLESYLSEADALLYLSKQNGRNRISG